MSRENYYPFGLEIDRNDPIQTPSVRNAINRYNFLEKETQPKTGYIDLQARFYDPSLGKFMQVDPVTDTQENYSTYQYGWNNPILRSDPNGDCPFCPALPLLPYLAGAAAEAGVIGATVATTVYAGVVLLKKGIEAGVSGGAYSPAVGMAMSTSEPGKSRDGRVNASGSKADAATDTNNDSEKASRPRNPHGAKGKRDHQEKVGELSEKARTENPGMQIINERKISTEGSDRRPDVQVVDPKTNKTTRIYEAERRPKSQRNLKREEEYKRLGIPNETHKVGN